MPDMFTEGDRSIRKIPALGAHRAPSGGARPETPQSQGAAKSKTSLFFWGLLAVLACAVAGLLLSTFFERADVHIVPKSQTVDLPSHMVATENGGGSGLGYTRVLVKSVPKDFIPIQGSLSGGQIAVIDPAELAQVVARQTVSGYKGEPVVFADASTISVSAPTNTPTFGHMLITLTAASSSSVVLLWQIDTEALQKALLGANRSDFQSIVKTFGQGIAEAHLRMRPFWKVTLPSEQTKLVVMLIQPAVPTLSGN